MLDAVGEEEFFKGLIVEDILDSIPDNDYINHSIKVTHPRLQNEFVTIIK
jgi:hypothetical protein